MPSCLCLALVLEALFPAAVILLRAFPSKRLAGRRKIGVAILVVSARADF